MPLRADYLIHLREKLTSATHGERKAIMADAESVTGLSQKTLYRQLARHGYNAGRKQRRDRGKTAVDTELARYACGMVNNARRATGKKTLPLTAVVEILDANGRGCMVNPATGEVSMPSPSSIYRIAARNGFHPEQLKRGKPSVQMASLHPNHVWQADASVCVLFYLPDGHMEVFDEARFYKNKPQNLVKAEPARVIRWVITDHYSGAFFLRYTQGAENQQGFLAALFEAMCRRDARENDCLYGVPKILLADKGSAITGQISRNVFDSLDMAVITHKPGNPRAKGQVEQAQNLIETQFEGRLRMYRAASLAELNARADEWRIAFNLTARHGRHGKTRHAMWRAIAEEHLRVPSGMDVLWELASSDPAEMTVPHSLVLKKSLKSYGPQKYDLRDIDGILPGGKILVQLNPFTAPALNVTVTDSQGAPRVYAVEPLEIGEAGFRVDAPVIGQEHKSLKDTMTDTALKDMHKQAYGAATLEEADKARKAGQRAYADIDPLADVRAVPMRQYMPRRGRDLTLAPALAEAPPLSLVDAALELSNRFRALGLKWTPEHMAKVREWHGETVPADALKELTARLLAWEERRKFGAGVRLVSGGAS